MLVANAYADWRMKDVNQYQTDLYSLGIDLIHVLGRRWGAAVKNAVDVKMAVDAVSLMSTLPHIDVFVIASGDRDFIHVLKEPRRHGKTVVGVSPNSAVSEDFAALCDRFLRYEALTESADATGAESIEKVRRTLADIVRERPDGILGSALKVELRRRLSSSFDESTYGYGSFSDFLAKMDDIVKLERPPATGGDLRAYPPSTDIATGDGTDARTGTLHTHLKSSGYEPDKTVRRETLVRLFDAMSGIAFTLPDVHDALENDAGPPLPMTKVVKYARMLFYYRVLLVASGQEGVLFRERRMRLRPDVDSPEALVLAYETGAVMRLVNGGDSPIGPTDVAAVLALDRSDGRDLEYCTRLLTNAQDLARTVAATRAGQTPASDP